MTSVGSSVNILILWFVHNNDMSLYSYEYTTRVVFEPSIGRHNILLRCLPAREAFQQCQEESFILSESFWHKEGRDGFGNRIISGGTSLRHATMEFSSHGIICTSTYCIPDANPHPIFSLKPATTLNYQATSGDTFLEQCLDIMHYVHRHLEYCTGITTINTSLEEVLRIRKGVCQDYAHLMIALCRQAGFPARYVCGLMQGEGQTHAWVEVHDGQCWYAFDPTNDTAIATGYIKLAHGRNAIDCPVTRGTFLGCTTQITNITTSVKEI